MNTEQNQLFLSKEAGKLFFKVALFSSRKKKKGA